MRALVSGLGATEILIIVFVLALVLAAVVGVVAAVVWVVRRTRRTP